MNYFQFMKYKWLYFGVSLLVTLPGLFSLLTSGLKLSIDFTGGSLLELQASQSAQISHFFTVAENQGLELASVQPSSDHTYLLRLKPISQDQADKLKQELAATLGQVTETRFETVGPTIGAELTRKAILAVVVASIFIIVYITWSFKTIPRPYSSWKFGASAVIALLHDVLIVVGLYSLFGRLFGVEIDALFVTALLTVIGFSVHDTIVVFDRIRENLGKYSEFPFEELVNHSLLQTLGRSLSTSLTVVFVLLALLLFGGASIRNFVLALLVGIISGTYSSIFNASPLLVVWNKIQNKSRK